MIRDKLYAELFSLYADERGVMHSELREFRIVRIGVRVSFFSLRVCSELRFVPDE